MERTRIVPNTAEAVIGSRSRRESPLQAAGSEPVEVPQKRHTSKDGLSAAEAERPDPRREAVAGSPAVAAGNSCCESPWSGSRSPTAVTASSALLCCFSRSWISRHVTMMSTRDSLDSRQQAHDLGQR
jgi:hypothetical protein